MAARKTKINHPSFFKILFGDFSTKLRVPPAFVKNLKEENLPLDFAVSVRSLVGTSWMVKVEGNYDDSGCWNYYFTKGWRKMVKDLQLTESDFLVFYLVAEDAFQLAVYDPTGCQKKITPPPTTTTSNGHHGSMMQAKIKVKRKEVGKEEKVLRKSRSNSKRPCFERTLAHHQQKFLTPPLSFLREAGLCNKKKVVLRDPNGKKWHVVMNERTKYHLRYDLVTGWSNFTNGNGFHVGDTLRFEFVEGCLIDVKVVNQAL